MVGPASAFVLTTGSSFPWVDGMLAGLLLLSVVCGVPAAVCTVLALRRRRWRKWLWAPPVAYVVGLHILFAGDGGWLFLWNPFSCLSEGVPTFLLAAVQTLLMIGTSAAWIYMGASAVRGTMFAAVLKDLKHKNPLRRAQAASRLGHLGDTRAVEPLQATMDDESQSVRQAAAEALKKIRAGSGEQK